LTSRTTAWGPLLALLALFLWLGAPGGGALDRPVLAWLHQHRFPLGDALALALTRTASAAVLGPLALALGLWAYRTRRDWRAFALRVGGALVLDPLAKLLFARPRPHLYPFLVPEGGYGFPSGHATASLALVLGLLFLEPRLPRWAAVLGLLWAFLVGLSRVYLQVHYPSDVLGGWALTLLWALALRPWRRPSPVAENGA
jgi:undecaprenyl-diphosphatase